MKIVLTKIDSPQECSSSEPITPGRGEQIRDLKEEAARLFKGSIEGYQVHHNGFEFSEHFDLCDLEPDLDSDIIHLDLFKPVADEETVHLNFVWPEWEDEQTRGVVNADNSSEVKFFIIYDKHVVGGTRPHVAQIPVGREVQKINLKSFYKEGGDGEEFRFGVGAYSEQIKGWTKKKYFYRLYRFDRTPRYDGCSITIRREDEDTSVVLTLRDGEVEVLDSYTDIPTDHKTERERYLKFMKVVKALLKLAFNVGISIARDEAGNQIAQQIGVAPGGDAGAEVAEAAGDAMADAAGDAAGDVVTEFALNFI